ncbi:MAG: hypothetical protein IJT94_07815 [Oscillibacter sp.]|nr:hypothetical protein [Oscillibacter sp.]
MDGEIKKDTFVRRGGEPDMYRGAAYGTPRDRQEQEPDGVEEHAEPSAPPDGAVSRAQEAEAALARGEKPPERDPEKEFMANAVRRAYDQELEALAGLALFRSYMSQMGREGGFLPPPSKEDMDARLRRILDDPDR